LRSIIRRALGVCVVIAHADIRRFVYETGSPFKRLEALLAGVRPNPDLEPITMTVGEPRHAPPAGIIQALTAAEAGFAKYPAINGTPDHRHAIADWLVRRYDLTPESVDPGAHILPLNGSREGLVFAARTARDLRPAVERPVIVMQNPFYQAYAAGALMAECDVVLLDEDDTRGQAIPEDIWQRTVAAYIASPTNPQGQVLSHGDWHAWIELARLHEFFLFADECYSEIYRRTPPPGVLEVAARSAGGFRQIVSFNSLSKRSNLPGLRTGFAAGDEAFMAAFMRLRNMGGPQVPFPCRRPLPRPGPMKPMLRQAARSTPKNGHWSKTSSGTIWRGNATSRVLPLAKAASRPLRRRCRQATLGKPGAAHHSRLLHRLPPPYSLDRWRQDAPGPGRRRTHND
jgi:histidinol-phosphate/aromatic aminotransferase/cobyric acid decarboxylase-like protein